MSESFSEQSALSTPELQSHLKEEETGRLLRKHHCAQGGEPQSRSEAVLAGTGQLCSPLPRG